jgi:long-chain acyl-CoA synthetase
MEARMRTLVDVLAEAVQKWPDLPAVTLQGNNPQSWTYYQLREAARAVASHLREQGAEKGDRVIIWGGNSPAWVAAFFGIQILGAVAVPLDARGAKEILDPVARATQPKYMFLGSEQERALGSFPMPYLPLEQVPDLPRPASTEDAAEAAVAPDDIAELVFTSGTTGDPKGVILTHGNIVSNVEAARSVFDPTPGHRVLSILPLSHMFEQATGLLTPMTGGATINYVTTLRPDAIFAAMSNCRVTNMGCVPNVLELFKDGVEREARRQNKLRQFRWAHALARRLPFSCRPRLFGPVHRRLGGHFEFFVVGGAHLKPELARWWEGIGIKVIQGYGMTEASPVVATGTLKDRDPESVGRPLPGVEVRIADDEEILVKGPNLTPGYWQNREATQRVFTDGWYRTGDLGYLDRAGRLHIRGRRDYMIVLPSGLNVFPEEVEQVLTTDPRVDDAVVLGITRRRELEVHAVLLTGEASQADAIVRDANSRLAPHQRIQHYTVWPDQSFPLTPSMKPRRREIAQRVA